MAMMTYLLQGISILKSSFVTATSRIKAINTDMIGTYNAKFVRKVVLLYLTIHKGHALPGNTNANNCLAG